MIYYVMVEIATVLFSLQFLFNQCFQKSNGTDLKTTLVFSFYKSVVIVILMLFISGFEFKFTLFSLIMGTIYTLSSVLMTYFSLKAFAIANLSVYSVFSMLGGMLFPFMLGVALYHEQLSFFKIICCALVVLAVLMNLKSGKNNKKTIWYFIAVFVLNGMAGVISKIHQSSELSHTDSTGFMIISSITSIVICGIWLATKYKKIPLIKGQDCIYISGYGVFNGVGNLFLLIALNSLPASIQYPLVTGGVMVCSTVISKLRKENPSAKEYLSAAIAFCASVLITF